MVSSNNSINNTVGASISGVTNTLTVTNPSNTASSQARSLITVGGGTAGDAYQQFSVNGVTDWTQGIDNNDSDALVIANTATLGTGNTWRMAVDGTRTLPLQPSFRATLSAPLANATGDGTIVSPVICNTEVFDRNGDYDNTTGIFTAPVDGIYLFTAGILFGNLNVAHVASAFQLTIAGAAYLFGRFNPGASRDSGNFFGLNGSTIAFMSAGQTAFMLVSITGGTKTVTVGALAPSNETFIAGFLLG